MIFLTDTRIQSYPGGDYSTEIPQISFAGFMLKKMKEHGDEIACVSDLNFGLEIIIFNFSFIYDLICLYSQFIDRFRD